MNTEKKVNKVSAIKEGILSAFAFGTKDINLEMIRESKKTPYVYLDANGDNIFLIPVDHKKQVYYDLNHQCFIPAEDLETEYVRKLKLNVASDELTEYISLFFSHYDFIMQLETKYVEHLQKVKELLKHVVVFQVQSNVMFEDANERIMNSLEDDRLQQEYIEEYLEKTNQILQYRKKLVGVSEKQEIGTLVYGYQVEPGSYFVYLLDEHSVRFPVVPAREVKNEELPEYYAVKESIKPLNKQGLASPLDVNYFYHQLMSFYTSKIDVYQSSYENKEAIKKLSMKKF